MIWQYCAKTAEMLHRCRRWQTVKKQYYHTYIDLASEEFGKMVIYLF